MIDFKILHEYWSVIKCNQVQLGELGLKFEQPNNSNWILIFVPSLSTSGISIEKELPLYCLGIAIIENFEARYLKIGRKIT